MVTSDVGSQVWLTLTYNLRLGAAFLAYGVSAEATFRKISTQL